MPIYEYECPKCGEVVEILEKINEKSKPKCEGCSTTMDRIISNCSFQLKGNGWYATDYKNKSTKSRAAEKSG